MRAGAHTVAELLLQGFAAFRIIGDAGADLGAHGLHRGWAVGGDHCGGIESPCHQPISRDDRIDQSDPCGEGRIDEPAGQQQIHRMHMADLVRELYGGAAKRVDRPAHLGQTKAGL